jgi:hypothetical protein
MRERKRGKEQRGRAHNNKKMKKTRGGEHARGPQVSWERGSLRPASSRHTSFECRHPLNFSGIEAAFTSFGGDSGAGISAPPSPAASSLFGRTASLAPSDASHTAAVRAQQITAGLARHRSLQPDAGSSSASSSAAGTTERKTLAAPPEAGARIRKWRRGSLPELLP